MSKASKLLTGLRESLKKRPLVIMVPAILLSIWGCRALLIGLLKMWGDYVAGYIGSSTVLPMIEGTVGLIVVAVGVGLWRLRRWARRVFIVGAACILILSVFGLLMDRYYWQDMGEAATWNSLIHGVGGCLCIWLMYLPHVKRAFGIPTLSSQPPAQTTSASGPTSAQPKTR